MHLPGRYEDFHRAIHEASQVHLVASGNTSGVLAESMWGD
jgi:hypothetical protein